MKAGDRDGAAGKTTEAIARLSEVDAPLELGRAHALLASLMAGSPEGEQARQQARELFERLGAQLDLAQLNEAVQLQE
ncbi:hypothetical protein D3C86_1906280 [compost metagenome]